MITFVYDGTFQGLLSTVFDIYEQKEKNFQIYPAHCSQSNLFGETRNVISDEQKSSRVLNGLKKKLSADAFRKFYKTFLSEEEGMENKLFRFVQYVFGSEKTVEQDYSHDAVRYVHDMAKKVHREKHRMEAFVRFKLTSDNIYYSIVEPDFNVLPLILTHFEKRYADQKWLIYDERRKYGLYYDLVKTQTVEIEFSEENKFKENTAGTFTESEPLYQQLWKNYFDSVNIKSRKNMKLHIRHMPFRYWKNLPEKVL